MRVLMLEHYQDAQVHYAPQQVVDVSAKMGAWLVENHKAVAIVEEPKPVEEEQTQRLERRPRRGKHESDNSFSNN